jgi:hypothetical protein
MRLSCNFIDSFIKIILFFLTVTLFAGGSVKAIDNQTQLKSHTIEVNEVDLYYRTVGEAPLLLLLKEYTLNGEQWELFVEELTDEKDFNSLELN